MRCKLTLLTTFICSTFLFAQSTKNDKQIIQAIDNYLKKKIKITEPGISILAAKNGRIFYERGLGLANLELQVPLTPTTVFRIGSITKQFTAIAILQLVEQGKLSLTDSIQKYIVDFPSKKRTITIEHLLTHTSGIRDYLSLDHSDPFVLRRDFTPKEVIDFFKNAPLDFEPGTEWGYSNSGYFLLGYVIELVSGMA